MTIIKNVQIETVTQAKGYAATKVAEFNLTHKQREQISGRLLHTASKEVTSIDELIKKVYNGVLAKGVLPMRNDLRLRHNDTQFIKAILLLFVSNGSIKKDGNFVSITTKGMTTLKSITTNLLASAITGPVVETVTSIQLAFDLYGKDPYVMVKQHEAELLTAVSNEAPVEEPKGIELTDEYEEDLSYCFEELQAKEEMDNRFFDEIEKEVAELTNEPVAAPVISEDIMINTFLPMFLTKALNHKEVADLSANYGAPFDQALEYLVSNGFIKRVEIVNPFISIVSYVITEAGKSTLLVTA